LTFKIKKLRSEIEDFRESMNNQVFFHHPDSIIALRHLNTKNSGTFQFEAITARIFFEGEDIEEDDGGKSSFDYKNYKCTAVPLSKNWALLNFDKDFIEKVMAHENSHDFIYVRDLQKNVTKESFDAGKLQEKMFKNFRRKKEYSGESGDKLIVKLKAKFTFSGRSVKAEKQSWFLKSVSKSHFVSRSRTRAQYSDWLSIEEDLLMHPECVGPEKVAPLIREVLVRRDTWLLENPDNTDELILESTELSFFDPEKDVRNENFNVSLIPHYQAAEKLVAGMRYCKDRNFYYGKCIESVHNGVRRYTNEVLSNEWVQANIEASFLELLKKRSESSKFIWVPVGKANPGRPFPYNYDKTLPLIQYPQGKLDTCASSSFASCLFSLGFCDAASWIENFGREYISNPYNNKSCIFQSLIQFLQQHNRNELQKNWTWKKIKTQNFNIWEDDENEKQKIKLVQVLGEDGWAGHALTLFNGLIFDSNLKYAVELNVLNLEFCIEARYLGILYGYEFSRKVTLDPMKKRDQERHKMKKKLKKMRKKLKNCENMQMTEEVIKNEECSNKEQQCCVVHPYKYNETNPIILFQKGKCNTSASSSLASCLHFIGLADTAAWIDKWGFDNSLLNERWSTTMKMIHDLQKSRQKEFNRKYQVKKINAKNFDIWDDNAETKQNPKLLQFVGKENNAAGHTVTIFDGIIFDSNQKHSFELNLINLEACIQSSYRGILHGYELVPPPPQQQKINSKSVGENVHLTEERNIFSDQNRCDLKEIEFDNKGNENPQDCIVEDDFV
jgi:hypothetical protein